MNKISKFNYVFFYLLSISCGYQTSEAPYTENEIFNDLLNGSYKKVINLDEVIIDTILIDESNKLGEKTSKNFSEPVYLGFPTNSFIKLDDSLYIASKQRIYVMDDKGKWQRTVGRKGRGPGEFDSFVKIESNSRYIFAFDYGNSRIYKYDYNLNLISSIQQQLTYSPLWKSFGFSDSSLYLSSDFKSKDDLISVYSLDVIENKNETFWPKIIPDGLQPKAYNNVLIDANKSESIAITYLGTPYLFILDQESKKIDNALYFKSSHFLRSNNPSLKPRSIEGNSEKTIPRVRSFIKQIILKDDHKLYFTVSKNVYQLIKIDEDYYLNKAWCFVYKTDYKETENPKTIDFSSLVIENEEAYLITFLEGLIYRAKLSESKAN